MLTWSTKDGTFNTCIMYKLQNCVFHQLFQWPEHKHPPHLLCQHVVRCTCTLVFSTCCTPTRSIRLTCVDRHDPLLPIPPQHSSLEQRVGLPIWKSLPSPASGARNESLLVGGLGNIKAPTTITTQLCLKKGQTPTPHRPRQVRPLPNYQHARTHTHDCSYACVNACMRGHAQCRACNTHTHKHIHTNTHSGIHCCHTPLEHLGRGHDESVTTGFSEQREMLGARMYYYYTAMQYIQRTMIPSFLLDVALVWTCLARTTSCCVFHMWKAKSGGCPDPIVQTSSGVPVWKRLERRDEEEMEGDSLFTINLTQQLRLTVATKHPSSLWKTAFCCRWLQGQWIWLGAKWNPTRAKAFRNELSLS